ncbi:type II toxin-antitoxin system Phd/YefM family antitoxin [Rhodothermus marinus]|uniref:Antitoxin n=1 Tax=Rhodothermus marinus (strain ATCC 43812 / DSM 4252 / R-10) TaxID=518766 RepID=D0MD71_RHOM4|nr:type II toxin-antitoxin system Phd/YefM family antitoxin [Rhodothermus marinus]ACY48983.1 prevent-host-death family protein [Rhodothermus marinus DSM 4252]
MYSTKGIEAVATITELRSKTSELVEHAKNIERGILIQKNNEPYAVLISYDLYLKLLGEQVEPVQTTRRRRGRKKESTNGSEGQQQ